jgi:hypothetical protein
MAVRLSVAFTVLAWLALLTYAADHAGYVRLPWRPAPEAGQQSALLRATRTIDLETGKEGTPQDDLHWGMAPGELPFLGTREGAQIAPAGGARWEDMNLAQLARLSYAANQYSAWGTDALVHPGAVFAVRTAEGNFAKLRIAGLGSDHELRLEWKLYPHPSPGIAPADPSPAWTPLRDEALAAYREAHYQAALDACGKAVAAAEQAGGAQHALALVTCGGLTELQRHASRQTEDWLKQAAAIAIKLEQGAIVSALGPRETLLKERCLRVLAVFQREQKRPREAAENFALAVDAVRALPPPETGEQRMALRADLFDLGLALTQLGYRDTARRALGEAREYYLKTEPRHSSLKAIDEQLRRLGEPRK